MKMYVNKKDLNEEELRTGKVSYKRLVERYIGNIVLCNNIVNVDRALYGEIVAGDVFEYLDDDGNYYTKEEYEQDMDYKIYEQGIDIYQYFICDINVSEEFLQNTGLIVAYSEILKCYVLMVEHLGTGWSYVMTDVEWTENLDDVLNDK